MKISRTLHEEVPAGDRVDWRSVWQIAGIVIWTAIIVFWSVGVGIFLGLFWLAPMYICDDVGRKKNRGGFWWGFCLGWLGVIIVCCLGRVPTGDELELQRLQQQLQIRALQRQLAERP